MKQFLKYFFGILLTVLLLMIVLENLYTKIYSNSKPRNKYQYILQMKPQKIDYVFLGSSRTNNTINPVIIEKITGKKAINLGIEGAVLDDNLLQLKLLLQNKIEIRNLFLQVDYLFEHKGVSNIANSEALPYIDQPVVKSYLDGKLENFSACYSIPFYRYLVTDYKIGFREFALSLMNKSARTDLSNGFSPKKGTVGLKEYKLPTKISKSNATLDEIISIAKKNNIKLVVFCAPFCSKTQNVDYIKKLKKKLPYLMDFSNVISDNYFYDCGHLNEEGANIFTAIIIKESSLKSSGF